MDAMQVSGKEGRMEILSVVVAAFASFAFGAVWYMSLAKPWMQAAGIQMDTAGKPVNGASPMPFVISGICMILVAGMMHHIFAMSGIETPLYGIMGGFGIGLFFITPWVAMNYAYAMRPMKLAVIDGGYSTIGCTIIGLVLTLF